MNLDQWHSHPSFRKELSELLDHPTMKAALEIVQDTGNRPIVPSSMPAGVTLVEWFAMLGAKRDGYTEALMNLRQLAQVQRSRQQGPKAWETQPDTKTPEATSE